MEKGAGRSTQRVLPWHGYGSEYLQGTAKEMGCSCVIDRDLWREVVMFDWPPAFLLRMGSPFPRAFTKNGFIKFFFNKDIEMSYDMLYRQEKLRI
jgi:hypothetical protein